VRVSRPAGGVGVNKPALPVDREQLAQFVRAMFPYAAFGTFVTMRCFWDAKDGVALADQWRWVRVTGNADDLIDAAEDLAQLAALEDEPVVFAPPIVALKSRSSATEDDVANGLCVSVELDSNPVAGRARLEEILGPPTVAIESGGLWTDPATGELIPKQHWHLRLAEPTKILPEHSLLKEANRLASSLAGSDPTGIPLVHPLRWPGSWHRKAEPQLARIVAYDPAREITLGETIERLRAAAKTTGNGHDSIPPKASAPMPPTDLYDVTAAVACIPNDDRDDPKGASWRQWNDMGLRIHAATAGGDVGLVLFLNWSRRSGKFFNEAKTRQRWAHYAKSPPTRTNAGALFNLAREHFPAFVRPSTLGRQARFDASAAEFDAQPQPPPPEQFPPVNGAGGAATDPPSGGHNPSASGPRHGAVPVLELRAPGPEPTPGARSPLEPSPIPDGECERSGAGLDSAPGNGGDGEEPPGEGPPGEKSDEPPDGKELVPLTAEDVERQREQLKLQNDRFLGWLNRDFAIVVESGKAIVVRWRRDPILRREMLDRITFADFKRMFLNRSIERIHQKPDKQRTKVEITTVNLADFWLTHAKRRQYLDGIAFSPHHPVPASYMNLWRGFVVEPRAGDWSLLRTHVLRVICRSDVAHFDYLLNIAARMFQEPHRQGEVAVVIRGAMGAGKGIFLTPLVRAWGQHGLHIMNANHLVGHFNDHLRDCVCLFADEAFYASDKQHERILKGLITESTMMIERKRFDAVQVANMLHIWMSSDSDWVIPVSIGDRRFYVLDAADNRVGHFEYFKEIDKQMKGGGLAAMIHELLHRNISSFNTRQIPQTEGLKVQQSLSLSSLERWWLTVLERGFVWKSRHGAPWFSDWHEFFTTELLERSYHEWCNENRTLERKSRMQLGMFMTKLYVHSRPSLPHPVYEIDVIDRAELRSAMTSGDNIITPIKTLDEIAIVRKQDQPGYRVEDLDVARARYLEHYDITPIPWRAE
jgi:Family of unknown function (DUF5906)/Primase C terminal 2 (PriCT-2)